MKVDETGAEILSYGASEELWAGFAAIALHLRRLSTWL